MKLLERLRQSHDTEWLREQAERLRAILLSENDLFHGIGAEEIGRIAERLSMTTCRSGQLIYAPGQTGEALFLLKAGRVRIYRLTPDGHKLVLTTLDPGSAFGEMTFLGQSMIGSFAEAMEECAICIMSRVDIEEIIAEHPAVALRMIDLLARRLQTTEQRLEEAIFDSVPTRLARLLLDLSTGDQVCGYSHQELADVLGTSRETVSRIVRDLRDADVVTVDRRAIHILDRERLEAQAAE